MIEVSKLSGDTKALVLSSAVGAVSLLVAYPMAIYLREKLEVIKLSGDTKALILFGTVFAVGWLTGYPIAVYLRKKLGDKKKAIMIGITVGAIPAMISFGIMREWPIWDTVFMTVIGIAIANIYVWIIHYYRVQMGKED